MAALFLLSTACLAHAHRSLCERAYAVRHTVTHRYGYTAAGRNLCRQGTLNHVRATTRDKARYLRALEALDRPAPSYLIIRPGMPRLWAHGPFTVHYRPIGLAECIVTRESTSPDGSNTQANNGSHFGDAQWTEDRWNIDHGYRFAASPLEADTDEQLETLSYGLSHEGCSPWCPYDGCG